MDFITKPHQMINAKKKIEDMKNKTKAEFIKNWENILEGHLNERKIWTLEIDISAPQIIFVENFCDKNDSLIVVIDFGRLQLTNEYAKLMKKSSDAEEFSQDMNDNNDDDGKELGN
jgi:vacuolar protein sorting-associated protein 13D